LQQGHRPFHIVAARTGMSGNYTVGADPVVHPSLEWGLVAHGASPPGVFSAVADALARVLHVLNAGLLRYEPDGSGFVVAVG